MIVPTAIVSQVGAVVRPGGVYVVCGLPGTGRYTAAQAAVEAHCGGATFAPEQALNATTARQARDHMQRAGARTVLARLDDETSANILLKVLEEAGTDKTWVLVTRPSRLLATVASRALVLRTPVLTDAEVVAILESKRVSGHEADSLAAVAAGSITAALAARKAAQSDGVVHGLLQGMQSADMRLIGSALKGWGRAEAASLETWAVECLSGRWRAFDRHAYTPERGARAFAEEVTKAYPSRVRVRALAWARVRKHRAERGMPMA